MHTHVAQMQSQASTKWWENLFHIVNWSIHVSQSCQQNDRAINKTSAFHYNSGYPSKQKENSINKPPADQLGSISFRLVHISIHITDLTLELKVIEKNSSSWHIVQFVLYRKDAQEM